jgi:hypothetical protein
MKEAAIRKKVIEALARDGWVTWHPPKARFYQTDIFGVFDVIAARDRRVRFVQLTSAANVSARRRKIEAFFQATGVQFPLAEVWGYDPKGRGFVIYRYRTHDAGWALAPLPVRKPARVFKGAGAKQGSSPEARQGRPRS